MANFDPAFEYVIKHEDYGLTGVVTPEPNGGKARFGINSVFHPNAITDGFYEMEKERALEYAKDIYKREYWNGRGFDTIANQQVATKLFDMAVNMGNGAEIGVLQHTLSVPITYRMDAATKAALEAAGTTFMDDLVKNLKAYYQSIHDKHQPKYNAVLAGWLRRAEQIPT